MSIFNTLKSVFTSNVNYNELVENGALVIDVRTPDEFKSGHVKGSKNIPLNHLASNSASLNGKEVVLVCRSGARAEKAKSILQEKGITAYNAGAWQNLA